MFEHSGASAALMDYQFTDLAKSAKCPVIICKDTGASDDEYEHFLAKGRQYDKEHGGLGWQGIELEADESKSMALNYTSGTTGRPKASYSFECLPIANSCTL